MEFVGKKCCILIIGSKVLPLASLSRYTDEDEYLLDRDGILIVTNTFEENDMKFINCVYTNGIEVKSSKDIIYVGEELKTEDDESIILNRLFKTKI